MSEVQLYPVGWPVLRGKREWTGDWSDKSEKWSDGVRRELGWSEKNDGTFWMTWQGDLSARRAFRLFFSRCSVACPPPLPKHSCVCVCGGGVPSL